MMAAGGTVEGTIMATAPSGDISGRRAPADGRGDFDFLVGTWRVRHRRLMTRLAGDTRWEEFGGTCTLRPVLGGLGNVDDNVIALPAGTYRAATVRTFDPVTRRWSIWWIDARRPGIEPPVHGAFKDGVGTFFGEDVLDGRKITVRFIWSAITPTSARWEQAFSADGGATWETNWVMEFARAD
jgi:hypothetical protein